MKVKVDKKKFIDTLSVVSKATPSNPPSPILSGIQFKVEDDVLSLYSTDLEIGIVGKLKCEADKDIAKVVPAKLVKNYVDNLATDEFELKFKENKLHINDAEFNVFNADEFPEMQSLNAVEFEIDQSKLKRLIDKTNFAVSQSNDENRNTLQGMRLEIKENKIITVGTNTFRLAYKEINMTNDINLEKTIPYEITKILSNLLDEGKVNIIFERNMIKFKLGTYEIVSRTISGDYPNYNQVIPNDKATKVVMDKNDLKLAIKRANVFDDGNRISLTLDNTVKVSELISEKGHTIEKVETQEFEGDISETNIDGHYLLDVIKELDSNIIILECKGGEQPLVVKDEHDEGYKYLVMPIRK